MRTKYEKKQMEMRDNYVMSTGVSFSEMQYNSISNRDRIIVCLIKGLLIFFSCFGLNLLMIVSFGLPCSVLVIGFFALFLSMFVAFFYYRKLFFNLGYIFLLILFIVLAVFLLKYANSGMNAIINYLMEAVDYKLNLGGVRNYQELYSNRYLTITCCLILILFLEVCFLNSLISEYMSGFGVFLISFPIIQICIYLNDTINYFCIGMILIPIITCMFLRHSRKFKITLNKSEPGFRFKKNKIILQDRHFYKSNGTLSLIGLLVCIVFLIFSVFITNRFPFTMRNNHSAWKNQTDEDVAEFAMNGVGGYFNSYYATGGVSNGKLGGVRAVTLDYETDMYVDFVPYTSQPVYIKAFVGGKYFKNQWLPLSNYAELKSSPYYLSDYLDVVNIESDYLQTLYEASSQYSAYAKMHIKNIDANATYYYYPYYTTIDRNELRYRSGKIDVLDGDTVVSQMPVSGEYDVYFYPLFNKALNASKVNHTDTTELYRSFVYKNYLEVPITLKSKLQKICTEQNFGGDPMEIVEQIKKYFFDNFTYTLSPGKTPSKKDFVDYFLTKQKKGYCAHFATAGAMLLRQMGIPTRYVEGYCIDIGTIADKGDLLPGENISDWYSGYDEINLSTSENSGVVRVEVSDAKAHCWVEIYLDEFGWIPVELTTGRQESGEEGDDFWSNFTNLFAGDDENALRDLPKRVKQFGLNSLLVLAILISAFIFVLFIIRLVKRYFVYYLKGNKRLTNQFVMLNRVLIRYHLTELGNVYHKQAIKVGCDMGISEEAMTKYIDLVNKASFSNEKLTKNELKDATKIFNMILKKIRSKLNLRKKIVFVLKY